MCCFEIFPLETFCENKSFLSNDTKITKYSYNIKQVQTKGCISIKDTRPSGTFRKPLKV